MSGVHPLVWMHVWARCRRWWRGMRGRRREHRRDVPWRCGGRDWDLWSALCEMCGDLIEWVNSILLKWYTIEKCRVSDASIGVCLQLELYALCYVMRLKLKLVEFPILEDVTRVSSLSVKNSNEQWHSFFNSAKVIDFMMLPSWRWHHVFTASIRMSRVPDRNCTEYTTEYERCMLR